MMISLRVCRRRFTSYVLRKVENVIRLGRITHLGAVSMTNQYLWSQDKALREWIRDCRLDGFSKMVENALADSEERAQLVTRMRENGPAAVMNLHKLCNDHHANAA